MEAKYYKINENRLCWYDGLEYYHIQINDDQFAIVQKDFHNSKLYTEITKDEFYEILKQYPIAIQLSKVLI